MNGIMTYLRPASPLAVLAIGQMFVLAMGGFDLSIGAIVTFCVIASSKFLANDPANALPNILILLAFGVPGRAHQWIHCKFFESTLLHHDPWDDDDRPRWSLVLRGWCSQRIPDG